MTYFLKRYILVVAILLLTYVTSTAQEIIISDGGFYVGCSGTILDTGGSSQDYGNNENITYTICPDFDAGEVSVNLHFFDFSLAEDDFMVVYQGTNSLFPLEGMFFQNDLMGQTISTSEDNFTGCITVQFISNNMGTGNFAFLVSCGEYCQTLFVDVTASICEDEFFSLPDGSVVSESGEYVVVLPSELTGCDSIITTTLSVNEINNTLTIEGMTLTSNTNNAEYQWLDCNNGNSFIDNANDQSYEAQSSGNYAVVVTIGNCSETSECLYVTTVSASELDYALDLNLFPNPSNGMFSLNLVDDAVVYVFDVTGATLYNREIKKGLQLFDLNNLNNGVYSLVLISNGNRVAKRLVVVH